MLKLDGEHIKKLNDTDLRSLVLFLSEAELRRHGLPVSAVTAGGNQNAGDGGIDVRVESAAKVQLDFIPASITGYQVKCEDMNPASITAEMCPKGLIRPAIAELVASGGAYVIVSSKGSVAESALQRRLKAMRDALAGVPEAEKAVVRFYDRDKLATWVRSYPGVELWVRERIGEPLSAWRGYGSWSGDPDGSDYLLDDAGRVLSRTAGSAEAMRVVDGIAAMRETLSKPGGVVRLVGLSGMGKTRLVQALFDPAIGKGALEKETVAYADQGLGPQPSVRDMMVRLGANDLRAVVVIDNCNPSLHRALTQTVSDYPKTLSLITIEHDVADDEPEETSVYELTPASESVLTGILERLSPDVSQSDGSRIAEFAGGNARIALALARTLAKGETLGVLNDNELFKRLFLQNQQPNEELLLAAQVSALVYSFDGETIDGAEAELPILSNLLGIPVRDLYRHVAELRQRNLVQRRSRWRAVLPHALANRLAKDALRQIPPDCIVSAFSGHERLLRSFTRRLGYLHDSEHARVIAMRFLAAHEWLANPARLNGLGLALFQNLAPLSPAQALSAIEAAATGVDATAFTAPSWPSRDRWISLLRSLAYDPALFPRAARVLLRFAATDTTGCAATDAWKELFHIVLSGTNSPPEQRFAFVRELLTTGSQREQELAVNAVEAMLAVSHFVSSHDFAFGARPQGYGWEPTTLDDERAWYLSAFALCQEVVRAKLDFRKRMQTSVASNLRMLWLTLDMDDEIASLVSDLSGEGGWPEGWTAVRFALRYDAAGMPHRRLEKLKALERFLRPRTLIQRVRSFVFSDPYGDLDILEGDEVNGEAGVSTLLATGEWVTEEAQTVAAEVSEESTLLEEILPELFSDRPGRQLSFGQGLASASADLGRTWEQLCAGFAGVDPKHRDAQLLCGFIQGAATVDSSQTARMLDDAVSSPLLAESFPMLQAGQIDDNTATRLLAALDFGKARSSAYHWVWRPFSEDKMHASLYREIVLRIAQLEGGFAVAVHMIGMNFHLLRSEKAQPSDDLVAIGRDLLNVFRFDAASANLDHHLSEIAGACLNNPEAKSQAMDFCERFAIAVLDYNSSASSLVKLASTLFKLQPEPALDAFIGKTTSIGYPLLTRFSLRRMKSILNGVDPAALLTWVAGDPATRGPLVAVEVEIVSRGEDGEIGWSAIAAGLLRLANNKAAVLNGFSQNFRPRLVNGPLSKILRPYYELTVGLLQDQDPEIAEWACREARSLAERMEHEEVMFRGGDERFE